MLKKDKMIFFGCLTVMAISIFLVLLSFCNKPKLEYVVDESYHLNFSIEEGTVYLRNEITVKNNSSEPLNFYMIANTSNEKLVSEDQIYAYEVEHLDKKQLFTIASHATETYVNVIFKGCSTGESVKSNRLPPKEIIFQIVE